MKHEGPSIRGWWTPETQAPAKGNHGIKQALMSLNESIYILDIQGEPGYARGGCAIMGDPAVTLNKFQQNPANGFPIKAWAPALSMEQLGDRTFKQRHGLKYPYIAGAMANGITSVEMVKSMAHNGMMGFLGAGGLSIPQIEEAVQQLNNALGTLPFGCNLIHSHGDPDMEMATVNLYLQYGVRCISAAAFMRITLPLVYYRVKGIHREPSGRIKTPNQIIAKVSRIEVARQFFSPPPEKMVQALLEQGLITDEEAALSRQIPMAQDLTAEADSGGHTDNRPAISLFPTMISLKDEFNRKFQYQAPLCVGFAGGISTPESAAAAFQMGAAYILTGSINQSCTESGTSNGVKALLAQAQQADVAMAPAADMFEIGARVQVLKRGTMFSVRAEKLYTIYKTYPSFDAVPPALQREVEEKMLRASFDATWESTRQFFMQRNISEVHRAEKDPQHKMALVFRSYLGQSSRWSITGDPDRKMDYQIWCGPAMGAFNQWVKGSFLENPEQRHVVDLALNLLFGACVCTRAAWLKTQTGDIPVDASGFIPMDRATLLQFSSTM
ncbi:PfaD family protein [Desulfocicer vacuolatum DSM 3385]|uniref:PfaD family protein n=1 Tax=Desulfocicer vacuolatum DSM 3385 TaxID=1121400 RepID=A0A1W2C4K2_9BACT|nr:PfaD family polyunsaturated fatty acid/polyketide biosynthesis protein [Desulfocicer vacuolatum]SMC80119.1 PfaD family protein [Desulfocicer vacuolatum DSM 3385]